MASHTREQIKSAFLELLDEMPLSKITVRTIVEACGINRNSFYYHFQDIPSLLEEIVRDDCNKIIAEYPTIESLEECVSATVKFAMQHRRAVLHIYNSTGREIYEHYLWKTCEYAVTTYYNTVAGNRDVSESDKNIIINYHKCNCFGQIIGWLDSGMRYDISASISRLIELRHGQAEEIISRAERTK